MRVIREVVVPVERKTAVELTDREIALVTRALLQDTSNGDENSELYTDFNELRVNQSIPKAE